MTTLHTAYRPTRFEDVVGQTAAVKSLKSVIAKKGSQAFILSGPSGVGKTTLARIGAVALGCSEETINEIDAATHTGVDDMRPIQDLVRYRPFGKSATRAIIIDEAHGLSRNAWNSLLKTIEEPPRHVSFWFCTTELSKVPETIKTRCACFMLKPVHDDVIHDLVVDVAEQEKIKLNEGVLSVIVREASGSPRQALVNLALCRSIKDRSEAKDVLHAAMMSDPVLALCRFLSGNRGSWAKAMAIVAKMPDENPESVRIVVSNYFAAAAVAAETDKQACHFLTLLEAFEKPYGPGTSRASLMLSIGRVLFDGV